MLAIAYQFHVLPRYRDAFQHAWQAAGGTLRLMPGLVTSELSSPQTRLEAFTLLLAWEDQANFERFTRTWIGVWMLNGMGLSRDAFFAPIQTAIGEEEFAPRVGKRAA